MPAYIYTPLPPDDDEQQGSSTTSTGRPKRLLTRLLTIHKGKYKDKIKVDLEVVDLGTETPRPPEYEALSYAWGSGIKPSTVFVGKDKRTIPITANLDGALRHLRYRDRPRCMWIDALCIDQGNEKEQSRQVSYMGYIYRGAPHVVVWLGPSADDSDYALEMLEDLGSRIQVDWTFLRVTGVTKIDDERWGDHWEYSPLSERQYAAILALIQRPWFYRLWIRQEVSKANDKSRVICGKKAVSWAGFQRGLFFCLFRQFPRALNYEQHCEWTDRSSIIVALLTPNRVSLGALRDMMVGTLCADPRDRIYALLGLLYSEEKQLGIVPDYSKTTSELYQDVALRYLKRFRALNLLLSCGPGYSEASSFNITCSSSIPTWVPDWSVPATLPRPLRLRRVFCPFPACAEYIGDGILRVSGVFIGSIQDFIELDVSTDEQLAASIRALVPRDAIDRPYPGGGNLWDAYRIALCAEDFCDRTEPPNFEVARTSNLSLSLQGSNEAMRSIMATEDHDNNFLRLVRDLYHTGRLYHTREGYLGWGSKSLERGDQIVTFHGCHMPMVIRRSPDFQGEQFKVVGPCYLHGFMFGEAFLGPLPDSIRPVVHIGKSNFPQFHDSRTGDVAVEDPRLSNLPVDLDEFRKGRDTGDVKLLDIGPETWRSHGVEVVNFDLV